MTCPACKDKHYPPNQDGTPYIRCAECGRDLSEPTQSPQQRSKDLNAAYWAWLTEVARDCENRGITMSEVIEKMAKLEVTPTKDNLHQILAIPYIKAQHGKDSSSDLTTAEMQQLIDGLQLFFGHHLDCDISFSPDMHRIISDLVQ